MPCYSFGGENMILRRYHNRFKKEKPVEKKTEIDYSSLTVKELRSLAKEKGIEGYYDMKKDELIEALKG